MTDRLAGLLRHYTLAAEVFHSGPLTGVHHYAGTRGYMHVVRSGRVAFHSPGHAPLEVNEATLVLYPRPLPHRVQARPGGVAELLCAEVELGATAGNPLAVALPPLLPVPLTAVVGLGPTLDLLFTEAQGNHCGRQAAIDRLCELLLIQLLRYLMDAGLASDGLLAGLAEPRLARALTAMHDAPEAPWRLETLAAEAGMSRARFAEAFRQTLGVTPAAYLTQWRLDLACTLLRRGRPMGLIAEIVGYGSANALARAFRVRLGCAPRDWLRTQLAPAAAGEADDRRALSWR